MLGWVKWLVFILSFAIPPIGVITFWVFSGREEELKMIGKWSLVAGFAGCLIWIILSAFGMAMHRMLWGGMGRW
jgi:hypothetical protein